jgi:UDP-N-acetylglucosamine acyltransferase
MIHPTAVIHPKARLDPSVRVGPYAVVDEHVEVGPGCTIGPHVYLTGYTTIGKRNSFHAGSVIGEAPQDLKYDGALTGLTIGDDNVFREHVTVHRASSTRSATSIGSHNFFMANSHVGHNCQVGDRVIIANGALLGGYVLIQDRAFISGNCLVHQFTRVGTLALMQGGSAISKDLPPFTVARGDNHICGLNIIGMRRAEITSAERVELKALYKTLFRNGTRLSAALKSARENFNSKSARVMMDFIAEAKRGVCTDTSDAEQSEEPSPEN